MTHQRPQGSRDVEDPCNAWCDASAGVHAILTYRPPDGPVLPTGHHVTVLTHGQRGPAVVLRDDLAPEAPPSPRWPGYEARTVHVRMT